MSCTVNMLFQKRNAYPTNLYFPPFIFQVALLDLALKERCNRPLLQLKTFPFIALLERKCKNPLSFFLSLSPKVQQLDAPAEKDADCDKKTAFLSHFCQSNKRLLCLRPFSHSSWLQVQFLLLFFLVWRRLIMKAGVHKWTRICDC